MAPAPTVISEVSIAHAPGSELTVVSNAAGRLRVRVPAIRGDSRLAVAVEETVGRVSGVRTVYAYPRTGAVVIWYAPQRCDTTECLAAIDAASSVSADLIPVRAPRSA